MTVRTAWAIIGKLNGGTTQLQQWVALDSQSCYTLTSFKATGDEESNGGTCWNCVVVFLDCSIDFYFYLAGV